MFAYYQPDIILNEYNSTRPGNAYAKIDETT